MKYLYSNDWLRVVAPNRGEGWIGFALLALAVYQAIDGQHATALGLLQAALLCQVLDRLPWSTGANAETRRLRHRLESSSNHMRATADSLLDGALHQETMGQERVAKHLRHQAGVLRSVAANNWQALGLVEVDDDDGAPTAKE